MSNGPWWRDSVLYQLYPRSFADSDGDGVGDLRGVTEHLDHLAWLGVDAVWLSPVFPSPDADWGYDVADYCDVHPELGTLADADALIARATDLGIRVVFDLVPNHTSDQHPWFLDARSSREAEHRDFYVWADPSPDGSPPNNWVSNFGGPAWTFDEPTGQYYLHNFLPQQPDLNWWHEPVRQAFDDILRFWFDRGVAGFRIDVCHMIVKDAELRDNPPAEDTDHFMVRIRGQRQVFNADRPEVHDVLRRWRQVAESYNPPRLLLGEVYLLETDQMARYYGERDDELGLAFNFPFVHAPLAAAELRQAVDETEGAIPAHGWPVWTGSNHDVGHFATRWAKDDPHLTRCALMMLLTLRGSAVLYYGDELGMPDTPLEYEQLKDPVGLRFHPYAGRDPGRTPMPWTGEPGAGFTSPGVEPWLPFGAVASCNVADQRNDPRSTLHLCRDLLALRRRSDDLRAGGYRSLDATPEGVWAYQRGERTTVVLNLGESAGQVEVPPGTILLSSGRDRDGEVVDGSLSIAAGEAVILET